MDWKTIGNYALLIGLFVTTVTMFRHIDDRLDRMQFETNARFDGVSARFDRLQAETNGRFDGVSARFDRLQAETNGRFDAINARFDAAEVANSRQHHDLNRRFDEMFEVLRAFEGRISRLEGRMDEQSGAGAAE